MDGGEMTAEIINLAEYRANKQKQERFKIIEQRLAVSDIVIPISPLWLKELPDFPKSWIAVDLSCGYKPKDEEDK
jgi:hypothetical protein